MSSVRCVCSPQSPTHQQPALSDSSSTAAANAAAAEATANSNATTFVGENAAAASRQSSNDGGSCSAAATNGPGRVPCLQRQSEDQCKDDDVVYWSTSGGPDSHWAGLDDTADLRPPPNEEDELSLPRSVINKLIKESAGRIRVSAEARDVLVACCHEFVRVLSSRANLNCERHKKKLIGPDHILSALTEMGLQSYQSGCLEVMSVAQEEAAQKRKRMSLRYDCDGITEDELRREQQELFAKARQEHCELFSAEDLAQAQHAAKFLMNSTSLPCSADDDYDQAD